MSDGICVGTVAVLGGVFVGGVIVYAFSKCTNTSLKTCATSKISTAAKKTSEVAAEAKRAFSQGFSKAYQGGQDEPETAS